MSATFSLPPGSMNEFVEHQYKSLNDWSHRMITKATLLREEREPWRNLQNIIRPGESRGDISMAFHCFCLSTS